MHLRLAQHGDETAVDWAGLSTSANRGIAAEIQELVVGGVPVRRKQILVIPRFFFKWSL